MHSGIKLNLRVIGFCILWTMKAEVIISVCSLTLIGFYSNLILPGSTIRVENYFDKDFSSAYAHRCTCLGT